MASFISRIVSALTGRSAEAAAPQRGEPVSYEGFVIQAAPIREGNQWRLCGVIVKQGDAGDLERTFTRADTFSSREEAESFAVRKGKQIIDEQGAKLFADGEEQGRA
jgi:hypothetical protein